MKNISIIGVGLIGGSLGMALKSGKNRSKYRVTGVGRHPEKLKAALKLGAIDGYTTDFREGAKGADIIIIATPVETIVPVARAILGCVKPGAIITDAGSVKKPVVSGMEKLLKKRGSPAFIGVHPMAGSEKSGVRHSRAGMFRGAAVILTPSRRTPKAAAAQIRRLWEAAGARVLSMPADKHDRLVAMTSHLPHIVSACMTLAAARLFKKEPVAAKLIAGSFRDMTRITDSPPNIWAGISANNRGEILASMKKFRAFLDSAGSMLALAAGAGREKKLYGFFNGARNSRRKFAKNDN